MSSPRLLPTDLIPASLWDAEQTCLSLPPVLAQVYAHFINHRNLAELAKARNPKKPPVGGLSQKLADIHFAQAFDGSAARAQLAILDPLDHLPDVSDTFVISLAGNQLCLIDVPCGAGAAMYAFLTLVAQLRASCVLPRMPLDVDLIAADLSDPSRQFAIDIHPHLVTQLEEQAIFLEPTFSSWDVTDPISTTALIQSILPKAPNGRKRLLVVANFNGFLEKAGKRKEADRQLGELFRFCSGPNCRAVWIEPMMNRATDRSGTLAHIAKMATDTWQRFVKVLGWTDGKDAPHSESSAMFREPLEPDLIRHVHLAVMPISLERRS